MNKKSKNELIELLKNSKIDEFNQYRKDTDNHPIDLKDANLSNVDFLDTQT